MTIARRETLIAGAAALASLGGFAGLAVAAEHEHAGFADGKYVLPPLPYAYDALEPHIDAQTMKLHHDIHHQAYVDGLNKALTALADARKSGDFSLVKHWSREVGFHGAGHLLHTLFWEGMGPKAGGRPERALARQIDRDFGSFEAFQKHFSAAAGQVEGSGWAILAWEPAARQLLVTQAEKHQNQTPATVAPLLVLDVWEHAYYLKYQNRRPAYVTAWWNVVRWDMVARHFEAAAH